MTPLPRLLSPPWPLVIVYWLLCASAAHSANLTASALVTTTNRTVTLLLALPPVPLSCDSANDANLMGYWELDEPSGNATDSKGTNTLTDNNGVTTQVGMIGTSREFTSASVQYFAIPDNANLSNLRTVAAWCRSGGGPSAGQYPGIVSKWSTAGQNEFTLFWDGDTNRFIFDVTSDGTTETKVLANTLGAPSLGAWHYVVAWYDSTAHTLNIQVDNGAVDSISYAGGIFDGTSPFTIGSIGSAFTWTGQIDEVAVWNRVLTPIERQALYNLGLACRPAGT